MKETKTKAGAQAGRESETGTEAETVDERCLLVCSSVSRLRHRAIEAGEDMVLLCTASGCVSMAPGVVAGNTGLLDIQPS